MATVGPQPGQPNPVVIQPQPVVAPPAAARLEPAAAAPRPQIIIVSHSRLFYWWPVWLVGFIMAALTYMAHQRYTIGGDQEYYHPSSNLGVIYFMTLFLVVLITNVRVRGMASGMVLMGLVTLAIVFAYFGWWDTILSWLGNLRIHLNLGAYVWFSSLLFVAWALSVFVFDRLTYWRVTPGQVTQEFVIGAASQSFDTDNMVFEKYRYDVFRHWLLGFGSGDLHIQPFNHEPITVPNVLFVGQKVAVIQQMIATKPD